MKNIRHFAIWFIPSGLLLAALVVATIAPAAEAGKKYRYKNYICCKQR